ncbi:MAG TPA: DHHA1 domain-containing protein, partial [Anaerolineales bacterium]|nr:DHHA1 domain-containing protein [Anaerolineales bacterium]
HLLHASLRRVLGEHARQAGSLVAPDRLRFDFNHPRAVTPDERERIEAMVNEAVLANFPLRIETQPREKAVASGAMALFGEHYGETVRTISIGEKPRFSFELCGGTHVPATGVIGAFHILSEESVASGIRRIEALTGRGALEYFDQTLARQERLAGLLSSPPETLEAQVRSLIEERDRLTQELATVRESAALASLQAIQPENLGHSRMLAGIVRQADADMLRRLSDPFRSANSSHIVVLGSVVDNRPVIIASVSSDLVARGLDAGALVRQAAVSIAGSGGGRPTMAQAGGKNAEGLEQAVQSARTWVREHLRP